MSTTSLPERPAFHSLDVLDEQDRPPFSRLAVVSFVVSLISLFAVFSTIMLPLSMLAIALSVVVVWRLSSNQQAGGVWLAQTGLVLATASVVWSLSARAGEHQYLYATAAQNAQVLLDKLAAGKTFEALELQQVESDRQLTGTDLEAFYGDPGRERTEQTRALLDHPQTKKVIAAGPDADWRFSRGVEVTHYNSDIYVTVEMVSRTGQIVWVKLRRQVPPTDDETENAETIAQWNFERFERPK
ncbi:MAG: hypothetical protein KDA45_12955 [Planctomycetales bacterium]|nr:hypothetical protein [Planctomycetales bacterium]